MTSDWHKATNPDNETLSSTHPDNGVEEWADRMVAHLDRLLFNKDISDAEYIASVEEILRTASAVRRMSRP